MGKRGGGGGGDKRCRLSAIYLKEGGSNLGIGKLERSANLVLWAEEAFGAYGTGIGVTRPSLIC